MLDLSGLLLCSFLFPQLPVKLGEGAAQRVNARLGERGR
jgi:hypothetical protein